MLNRSILKRIPRMGLLVFIVCLVLTSNLFAECSDDPANLLQTADCDLDGGDLSLWTSSSGVLMLQTDTQCPTGAPLPIFSMSPSTGTALARSPCIPLAAPQAPGTYTAGGYLTDIAGGGIDICRIGVEIFDNNSCTTGGSTMFIENNNVALADGQTCALGISLGTTVAFTFESAQMIVACLGGGSNVRADNWFLLPGTATVPVEMVSFEAD